MGLIENNLCLSRKTTKQKYVINMKQQGSFVTFLLTSHYCFIIFSLKLSPPATKVHT